MLRSYALLAEVPDKCWPTRDLDAAARLIVGEQFQAYLMGMIEGSAVPDGVAAPRPRVSRMLLAAAAGFAALLAGTVVLWAHYGTAVFYEMILAGIAACF